MLQINMPIIRTDLLSIPHPIRVLPFQSLQSMKALQGFTIFDGLLIPVLLDGIPKLSESFVISIAILHDQCLYPFRVFCYDSISNGSTVIHEVDAEPFDIEGLKKTFNDLCHVIERIIKFSHGRLFASSITGIVRRQKMKLIGQVADEVAKHVG